VLRAAGPGVRLSDRGEFDYLRLLPEARGYLGLDDRGAFVVAGRVRLGTLVPRSGRPGDSPVVARFYAGGPNSMRGFGLRRLSPMVLLPVDPGNPEAQVPLPIGGNGLFEASVEARAQVSQNVLLAAFADSGTVTRDRFPLADPTRVLYAVGLADLVWTRRY
jgi:translocation and assembly module TamA